jgi:hypothetical protein
MPLARPPPARRYRIPATRSSFIAPRSLRSLPVLFASLGTHHSPLSHAPGPARPLPVSFWSRCCSCLKRSCSSSPRNLSRYRLRPDPARPRRPQPGRGLRRPSRLSFWRGSRVHLRRLSPGQPPRHLLRLRDADRRRDRARFSPAKPSPVFDPVSPEAFLPMSVRSSLPAFLYSSFSSFPGRKAPGERPPPRAPHGKRRSAPPRSPLRDLSSGLLPRKPPRPARITQ